MENDDFPKDLEDTIMHLPLVAVIGMLLVFVLVGAWTVFWFVQIFAASF